MGTLSSTILLIGVFTYAYLKYKVKAQYADTVIQSSVKEYALTDLDVISNQFGFNVAFGLSEFDGSGEIVEDPDYGIMTA